MLPQQCSLGESELAAQLARYRSAGVGAAVIERSQQHIVIRVGRAISEVAIEELIAVEHRCCPFFELGWEPSERRLSIAVSRTEDAPALDAIVHATGL
jgi:hypothetical protein